MSASTTTPARTWTSPDASTTRTTGSALLERRGYLVDALLDREATRARIVEALRTAIGQATDNDCLVFTFSGHGSWLPDDDRDEPDARDEMMCPYDVMKEQYLLDDELHDIFCAKAAGRGFM